MRFWESGGANRTEDLRTPGAVAKAAPGLCLRPGGLETFYGYGVDLECWWAMQDLSLRPSVCKASEPERCASDSTPLSENAEVIIWKMGH